jgi:hypothetical protein
MSWDIVRHLVVRFMTVLIKLGAIPAMVWPSNHLSDQKKDFLPISNYSIHGHIINSSVLAWNWEASPWPTKVSLLCPQPANP